MRTTITLDDDVAALIKKAIRANGSSLKQVVNYALRIGLNSDKPRTRKKFRTEPHDAGALLVPDISNIGEILSQIDEKLL